MHPFRRIGKPRASFRIAVFWAALLVFNSYILLLLVSTAIFRGQPAALDKPLVLSLIQAPLVFDQPRYFSHDYFFLTFKNHSEKIGAEEYYRRQKFPFYFEVNFFRHSRIGSEFRKNLLRKYFCEKEYDLLAVAFTRLSLSGEAATEKIVCGS